MPRYPLKELRKKVDYEPDIPRCENCVNYQSEAIFMRNSIPKRVNSQCKAHHFSVKPGAICNTWRGKDGSVIDA